MSLAAALLRCALVADRACRFGGGFFTTRGQQSMVRAVALLCGAAGLLCAVAAYDLAHRPHLIAEHVAAIKALALLASVFVAGGAVALLTRTKSTALPLPPDGPA
jgi:hypothetical protein